MFPIYLDNHATTHLDPNVLKGMLPFLKITGNASNKLHYYGKCASHAVETARCKVAALIQANPSEIIFTSGATESNNISILGSAKSNEHFGNHIITTQIEHLSILKSVLELKKQGFSVSFVKPDKYGCISVKSIYNEITKQTILIWLNKRN